MTKFSRTQKFTKGNIAKVPQDKAIIYKIKNRGVKTYTQASLAAVDHKRGWSSIRTLRRKKSPKVHVSNMLK